MRRLPFLAFCAMAGCAPPQGSADLETEIRRLHQEQERQSRQLELLENRVVIAEDSARMARQALVGVGAHPSVRIEEEHAAVDDPIPTANAAPTDEPETQPAADGDPNAQRPIIRATGREAPTLPGPPIVVRDPEPLPVVPVPPPPNFVPGPPQSSLPASAGPVASVQPSAGMGVSSARDPRAAPAYEAALQLARGGHCDQAIDALSQFLVRWPDHPFADHAMYWRGECIMSRGDVRAAASEFEGLLARFPVGGKAPDALYKLIACYRRLGDTGRARSYTERLLRDYPRSEVAARVRSEGSP